MFDLDLLDLLLRMSLHLLILQPFELVLQEPLLSLVSFRILDLFYVLDGLLQVHLGFCQSTGLVGHGIVEATEGCEHQLLVISGIQ